MEKYIEKILEHEITKLVIDYINNMSVFEYQILVIITGILALFLIYRWFGQKVFWASALVIFFAYLLYTVDLKNFYENQTEEQNERMKLLENEIEHDPVPAPVPKIEVK